MDFFGIPGTVRASFALYNTHEEVERLAQALACIVTDARSKARPLAVPPGGAEMSFPAAVAPSPGQAADQLAGTFDFLGDWSERYQHIIELGSKIPPMPEALKTEQTRVKGCMSVSFLFARKKPETADTVEFLADSDADIVRGLIAILEHLFSGQKAAQVLAFDIDGFFSRVGLSQNLSMGRRNGLADMVRHVHRFAASLAGSA
jgi:cysteine desulfurase/selenocysteine lyase